MKEMCVSDVHFDTYKSIGKKLLKVLKRLKQLKALNTKYTIIINI